MKANPMPPTSSPTSAPITFYDRVEQGLHNEAMRQALGGATRHFMAARTAALATLPQADAVRDRARLIRRHTIANLADYLEQFEAAATAAGAVVHWAEDAAAACAIVREIALANGVKTVAKSKSMVTEEIHLNPALEAAGIEVVETDLGEYIVQVAGDTPSHIVAPVLHMSRYQIGELFAQKLGVPYTHDPKALADVARHFLRDTFLKADMGISGVNFGVASTGTITLVTNEGNGRMVTSLPRIHVALMGLERVVPTPDDLAVMLQVLARSASGQKISVYTSMLTGPRRPGDPDGPEQVHIVLVDNRRSAMIATDLAEILTCIRCGACLNACPVYKSIGGHAYGSVYPGPMGSVLSPLFGGLAAYGDLPHASTLCGACREVCPVRIDLPGLLLKLRHDTVEARQQPLWLRAGIRLFRLAARRPRLFQAAGKAVALALRLVGRDGWIRRLPPPLNAWTHGRDFPVPAAESFQARWAARRSRPAPPPSPPVA